MPSKKTSNTASNKAVVEPLASPAPTKAVLSVQQQAAQHNANTHTKNDGSHIAQFRAARLSQHQCKAKINQQETN